MTKFTMWKKAKKYDLTIISKPHAHSHIMKKTHAKFHNNHNNRYKTVRGVALTRGTNCLYIKGGKIDKKILTIISKPHAHPHGENICKVSKQSVQNCKRSCAHKRYHCLYIEGEK